MVTCTITPCRAAVRLNSGVRAQMKFPGAQEIAENYGLATSSQVGQFEQRLFHKYGEETLIPTLVAAFPLVRRASGRVAILARLLRYSRSHPQVASLAIEALADRGYKVREHACSLLAYSLRPDVLPALATTSIHKDSRTRVDALAAADTISHQNHNYYVDRDHSGASEWHVG